MNKYDLLAGICFWSVPFSGMVVLTGLRDSNFVISDIGMGLVFLGIVGFCTFDYLFQSENWDKYKGGGSGRDD